jgi:16S rRNA (cytosine1402-N4)-methyltransferase
VLLPEVLEALRVQTQGRYIDCTVGPGGHTRAILEAGAPGCQVLALDADPSAVEVARRRLAPYQDRLVLLQQSFASLAEAAREHGFQEVHGVLMDLGLSSLQLEDESRGFSFQRNSPLDMRFDPGQHFTAKDIVNGSTENELTRVIARYGQEPRAKRISRAIVRSRPIGSTQELAQVVERAAGGRHGRIHPATRTFQSLRIVVNAELEALESGLEQAIKLLGTGGRLVVLSYHSLEDRLVKVALRRASATCVCPPEIPLCICGHTPEVRLVTKKSITPSPEEVRRNPRSRSARLRVAEHL